MLFEVPLGVVAGLAAAVLLVVDEAVPGLAVAGRVVPSLEVPGGGVGRAEARRLVAGAGLVLGTPGRVAAGLGAVAVVGLVAVELATVLLIAGFASVVVFAVVD